MTGFVRVTVVIVVEVLKLSVQCVVNVVMKVVLLLVVVVVMMVESVVLVVGWYAREEPLQPIVTPPMLPMTKIIQTKIR